MTSITRTVAVRLDPAAAFEAFTAQIDAWYPRGPHSFNYPERTVGVVIEPRVGGRWREVWRADTSADTSAGTSTDAVPDDPDAGYEVGRVLAWEPGRRLLVSYRNRYLPEEPLTEIEVRFEPTPGGGTQVTLEHRGWEKLPPEALREWAGRAWKGLVAAYATYAGATADHTGATADHAGATAEGNQMTEATTPDTPGQQAVVPMLDYEDGPVAMDWLAKAFGFVERTRWLDDEGRLSHGEMLASGGLIMLATPSPAYEGPRTHREHCARAAAWQDNPYVVDGVLVHVDDVDAHHAQAAQAGARILSEPEDAPYGRLYRVEDIEGHRWMFLQPNA